MKSAIKREPVNVKPSFREQDSIKQEQEPRLEDKIRYQLYDSGERDRLKSLLAERLEACGWKEEVKEKSKEYIAKRGRSNVTVEDVVKAVKPEGRAAVPDSVKAELLSEIRKFILSL